MLFLRNYLFQYPLLFIFILNCLRLAKYRYLFVAAHKLSFFNEKMPKQNRDFFKQ